MRRVCELSGLVAVLLLPASCVDIGNVFADDFLNSLTQTTPVASLPGNAPAIVVAFENRTSRTVYAEVTYRASDSDVKTVNFLVEASQSVKQAIACPVSQITLGELTDLSQAGAYVILGSGDLQTDPYVSVEPFGTILIEGATFECGDQITFYVANSSESVSGYRTFASVRSGS